MKAKLTEKELFAQVGGQLKMLLEEECGWLGDHSFGIVTLKQLIAAEALLRAKPGWTERERALRPSQCEEDVELMKKLGKPDEVRVVFGFDS